MGFSLQLVCPLLGVSHCLLPFLWLQGTGMPLVLLPPSWNGTVSYSHWQGRLLDEATSMGLRRWQREDGDKFYRQCVCCASLSRKWDVFVQAQAEAWRARRSKHRALVCDESDRGAVAIQMRHAFWQSSTVDW